MKESSNLVAFLSPTCISTLQVKILDMKAIRHRANKEGTIKAYKYKKAMNLSSTNQA